MTKRHDMANMSKKDEALKLAEDALKRVRTQDMELVQMSMIALAAIKEAQAEKQAQQEPGRNHGEDGDVFERIGAMKKQPAPATELREQEPVLWQILNGVCHAGIRLTENLAKEAAADMQKNHDLGGSWAAFHVRPLYTSPPAQRKPLTDEQINKAAEDEDNETAFLVGFYAGARFAEAAHGIKENT